MIYRGLIGILFLLSPLVLKSQENNKALFYYKEATKAFEEGNLDEYFRNLEKAYALRPDHPAIIRNMAKAYALKDSVNNAFSLLNRLWQMGLVADLQDSSFNSLKKDSRYNSVLRRLLLNTLPLNRSDTAFVIPQKGLITEGIAYDPHKNQFFIGSVRKGKILVFENNQFSNYLPGIEKEGAIMGMKVDPKRKILWVCTSFLPEYEEYTDSLAGKSSVIKYSLLTNTILKKYKLPEYDKKHSFGDLTLSKKGDVYITDSKSGILLKIPVNVPGEMKMLPVFEQINPLSLQGVAISDDGNYLFVADYLTGIYRVNLKDYSNFRLTTPKNVTTVGIDGLYYYKGNLLAIQNGVQPNRVVMLNLSKDLRYVESQRFLEGNHPAFDEPTLGVIAGDYFYYIASSQWSSMTAESGELKNHIVLRINLKDRRW